jgi:hypothetical protein
MNHQTTMYFSGSMTHPHVVERLVSTNVHRLFTFAAPKEVHEYLAVCDAKGIRANIMIDSGAFTGWNIGKHVTLDALLAYNTDLLQRYPHHNFVFIALDVIPGSKGRMATQVEIDAAVEQSYINFRHMLQVFPQQQILPVYHSGEDRHVRDRYLQHAPYMCLSMNQDLSEQQRLLWAREAMVPGVHFHGLAATGNAMLTQVDWYSVDSSGWLMVAAMGSILFPVGNKLKPLPISLESPSRKVQGQHFATMHEREHMVGFIRQRGYNEEQLATDYAARICWNIDMWNAPPWQKKVIPPQGLFT